MIHPSSPHGMTNPYPLNSQKLHSKQIKWDFIILQKVSKITSDFLLDLRVDLNEKNFKRLLFGRFDSVFSNEKKDNIVAEGYFSPEIYLKENDNQILPPENIYHRIKAKNGDYI